MMDTIAVVINGIIVFSEVAQSKDTSMMQAHRLRKIFCVDELNRNSIDAGVWIERGGQMKEVRETRMDDETLVVGSKMNAEGWQPEPEWYDDVFKPEQ